MRVQERAMADSIPEERWGVAQVTIWPSTGKSFVSMIEAPNADEQTLRQEAQKMANDSQMKFSVTVNFTLTGLTRDRYRAVQNLMCCSRGQALSYEDFLAVCQE